MTTLTGHRTHPSTPIRPNTGFFRNFGLYLYVFYVVYTPTFSTSVLASKFVVLSILAVAIIFHGWLAGRKPLHLLSYRPLRNLLVILFLLSLYVAVVQIVTTPDANGFVDLRVVQNNVLLLMAVHAALILQICQRRGFSAESILQVFYRLAAFQGIWTLLSFVIPSLKDVSNTLYQLTAGDRQFTIAARIYGVMGEYTFVTPIYHGILAAAAVYFAVTYRFRGLRYVPFILLVILLNGRTGLVILMAMVVTFLLWRMLAGRGVFTAAIVLGALAALIVLAWSLVSAFSPETANFLQRFLDDTQALVSDGTQQGNYAVLITQLSTVPDGMAILWGTGDVLDGTERHADVGYTNDLFMGGITYVTIAYGAFGYFILKNAHPDKALYVALYAGLLLANIKGQIFRGSAVLLIVTILVLVHRIMLKEPATLHQGTLSISGSSGTSSSTRA